MALALCGRAHAETGIPPLGTPISFNTPVLGCSTAEQATAILEGYKQSEDIGDTVLNQMIETGPCMVSALQNVTLTEKVDVIPLDKFEGIIFKGNINGGDFYLIWMEAGQSV